MGAGFSSKTQWRASQSQCQPKRGAASECEKDCNLCYVLEKKGEKPVSGIIYKNKQFKIGKADDNDLQINDPSVSDHHGVIKYNEKDKTYEYTNTNYEMLTKLSRPKTNSRSKETESSTEMPSIFAEFYTGNDDHSKDMRSNLKDKESKDEKTTLFVNETETLKNGDVLTIPKKNIKKKYFEMYDKIKDDNPLASFHYHDPYETTYVDGRGKNRLKISFTPSCKLLPN